MAAALLSDAFDGGAARRLRWPGRPAVSGLAGYRGMWPFLWLDLDPVRGFGLAFGRRFGLGVGFAFEAGCVLRAGFPRGVVGGDVLRGLVRAGLQGVQAGRPVIGLVLRCESLRVRCCGSRGGDLRIRVRFRKVPVVL